jgi:hypothetical protein
MLIRIELPRDRDYCGRLLVLDDAGTILFGPEWCAGRANDEAALRRGNDSRSCLLPYGDTPLGHYRLRRFISMRDASDRALKQFGRFGIVSLGATGGQALMADSVGRFEIWIHGGHAAPDGRPASTNGSVRLADPAIFALLQVLKGHEGTLCEVVEAERRTQVPCVWLDGFFDEGDPPSLDGVESEPEWPIPVAMAAPLRTIFLGEYDGGGTDTGDAGDHDKTGGGAGTKEEEEPKKEPIAAHDARKAQAENRPREGGWGSAIAGFFRSVYRDTTVSYNERDADDAKPAGQADVRSALAARFDAASARKFADLPVAAQNALIGLRQDYGAGLDTALPGFWSAATEGRWSAAVQALLRTHDQHIIARTRAADLLQGAIVQGKLS